MLPCCDQANFNFFRKGAGGEQCLRGEGQQESLQPEKQREVLPHVRTLAQNSRTNIFQKTSQLRTGSSPKKYGTQL